MPNLTTIFFLEYYTKYIIAMSLLDLTSCLYVKAIVAELFSHDNGLKKNPGECFPHFTGRVNKLRYDTVTSHFPNYKIPFQTFTDKFPAVIKSFQWIGKKSPEMKDNILTLFNKTQWQKLHQEEKLNHSVFDCKQCQEIHIDFLCQFPAKSKM